jgi:hypothetical protein
MSKGKKVSRNVRVKTKTKILAFLNCMHLVMLIKLSTLQLLNISSHLQLLLKPCMILQFLLLDIQFFFQHSQVFDIKFNLSPNLLMTVVLSSYVCQVVESHLSIMKIFLSLLLDMIMLLYHGK